MVLDRSGYEIWDDADPKESVEKAHASPYFDAAQPTKSEQDGPWQRLFVDYVKTGRKPPVDLELSHRGTVCCHLANISYRAGRKIKWDSATETVIGDVEANDMLARPRRKGFELPAV